MKISVTIGVGLLSLLCVIALSFTAGCNSGLRQQLSSHVLRPENYQVGELMIESDSIEFVTKFQIDMLDGFGFPRGPADKPEKV